MSTSADTLVACLTPPGTAAIATLALHGPAAWSVARELFRARSRPEAELPAEPGRFWFGQLTGEVADEVVVALKQIEPVPWVEIHCHGGRQVVAELLDVFRGRGLRVASWQELERRTAADPLRAEAAVALARARTTRTAGILLDQHHGALGRALAAVLAALDAGDAASAAGLLGELTRYDRPGRHLNQPWRVVIAGAPNVGKSSLVNALAGYQRSVVSPIPGTTRDLVTTVIAIDGWPVELTDTAGLHQGISDLERQGIAQAESSIAGAELCLWVLDASVAPVWPNAVSGALHLVVNKVDLPAVWDLAEASDALHVSARTGAGLDMLCGAISRWLVSDAPPPRAAVPFTPRICSGVVAAHRACVAGEVPEARQSVAALIGTGVQ